MSDNENQPKEEIPKEEKPDTHINLKVSDGSAEIFFKIKRSTPMRRLMETFCKRQGKTMDTLRFLMDGTRIAPESTADELGLEDGDVIEAHREQVGGC
ncbi:ubiquitin-like protein Smt3p [[Candida] railenensis]|uniref:Ubiquitin-like protein Smt3p n=1 Tax=[Candida] railenensis TaxID=45579 RepID=A0A9P0QR97_9ASCO|nr:ubiquitin-like protein Smt3p [[Candida] railenensis]